MSNPPESIYLSRRDKFEGAIIGFVAAAIAFQFSAPAGRVFLGGSILLLFSAIVKGGERIQ